MDVELHRWRMIKILVRIAVLAIATASPGAHACGIPVFRYALENWPASPYTIRLLQRGPLTGEAAEAAALLRSSAVKTGEARTSGTANLALVQIDLATSTGQAAARQSGLREEAELPWIQVCAPENRSPGQEVWSGPLNLVTVRRLIDSPQRREIARRLIAGDAAVWVLLESGDKTRDDQAEAGLRGHLEEAVRQCEAARKTTQDDPATSPTRALGPIRFTLLRVARGAAEEAPLAGMLLSAEPDLRTFKEPIACAVMGRGYMLPALVGKGISRDNVLKTSGLLTGDCTCEVKDELPGMDLLLTADWAKALEQGRYTPTEPRPALTGFAGFAEAAAEGRRD